MLQARHRPPWRHRLLTISDRGVVRAPDPWTYAQDHT
jgi:hypothetical protein